MSSAPFVHCCGLSLAFDLLAIVGAARAANYATPLDKYFDGLQTLRAQFTQTVKDAKGKKPRQHRPARWWCCGRASSAGKSARSQVRQASCSWRTAGTSGSSSADLDQVTVRKPADAALSSTPAMLLSGAANLRDSFTLTQAGSREGLDWVLVEPRKPEADFRRALFGFSKRDLSQE